MKRIGLAGLLILLSLAAAPHGAARQSGDHSLYDMLAWVPADATHVSYADYRALEQARPGTPTPADWAAFEALDDDARARWDANRYRLIAGVPALINANNFDAGLRDAVGFDFFDIDRSLSYDGGAILGGDFDPAAVTLDRARAYPLPPGTRVNLPGAVSDQPSLLTLPAARALAHTATDGDAALIQLWLVDPDTLKTGALPRTDPLPAYDLAALIDRQDGDAQTHLVAAVYVSEAEAQIARRAIADRLASMMRMILGAKPWRMGSDARYDPDAERWVAVVAVYVPLPPDAPNNFGYIASGVVYTAWVDSVIRANFTPLLLD